MASAVDRINDVIAHTSEAWADQWIAARVNRLTKGRSVATGALNQSFGKKVGKGDGRASVKVAIGFEDHGRFIDMKSYSHDQWGRNAIDRVEAWISAKGIQKFEPGFLKKYQLKQAPKDMLNRMAWGIMINRSNNKFRRKPWYAKAQAGGITDLFNQVMANIPEQALKELKDSIEHGNKNG